MEIIRTFGILSLVMSSVAFGWSPSQEPPKLPLDSFVVPEGFEVTPWAASPMLFNPTNMDVDHLGRIWVTEGVGYRGQKKRSPEGDRIVILEDTDMDGKADRSTVFWQDPELVSPLGIAVFDNVVMVFQSPNLLKLTDSFGFVFQNDNDDPQACRVTHMIEHGNAGFFSRDGKRTWQADRRPGQDVPTAEWRQEDPGTMPAGDVYGRGSPTGIAFYENGAMGEDFIGTLLSAEPGRNVIFSYQPEIHGAGFKLDRKNFATTNLDATTKPKGGFIAKEDAQDHFWFRPSDVAVGAVGAIYIADWTDLGVGGHLAMDDAASGVIYRIAPKGFQPSFPKIDFSTTAGAIAALKNPCEQRAMERFPKAKS